MTTALHTDIHPRWLRLIDDVADHGRLNRGIAYADEHRVSAVMLQDGDEIVALVQGSRTRPYRVNLWPIGEDLNTPHEDDFEAACTCPDGTWVCKHIVAVMAVLGRRAQQNQDAHGQSRQPALPTTTDAPNREYHIPPQRWKKELPQDHADFWKPGPVPPSHHAATRSPTHMLEELGEIAVWQGQTPFEYLMHSIYHNAKRNALEFLEYTPGVNDEESTAAPSQDG